MADINITFNDGKEIIADSYIWSNWANHIIIRFFNPESVDDILDFIESCDQSRFTVNAKFPNREKNINFINFHMSYSATITTSKGIILEIEFRKV